MKAILEFNLPDDQHEFDFAISGAKWHSAIWKYDQYLRSHLKYDEKLTEEQYKVYEQLRDKLWSVMNEHNLSFDQ
jgi:hypothetical protein